MINKKKQLHIVCMVLVNWCLFDANSIQMFSHFRIFCWNSNNKNIMHIYLYHLNGCETWNDLMQTNFSKIQQTSVTQLPHSSKHRIIIRTIEFIRSVNLNCFIEWFIRLSWITVYPIGYILWLVSKVKLSIIFSSVYLIQILLLLFRWWLTYIEHWTCGC